MTDASEKMPTRLRDQPGAEGELLSSAYEDAPSATVRERAIGGVLASYREDRRARRLRAWVGGGVVLAAAAAVTLSMRGRAPAPVLSLEPLPTLSSSAKRAPLEPSAMPDNPLAPCSPATIAPGQAPLIDDFEDGDARVLRLEKRAGTWVVFNDGTAAQTPKAGSSFSADRIPGGRGASRFGLHTKGGKFTKWGAVLAAELSPRRCYDASAYAGIEFWARGHGRFHVAVEMTQVVAEEYGGSCVENCYDIHLTDRALDKDWQHYQIRWEDLTQRGKGPALPFDPRSLLAVQFAVSAEQTPFDFWIDDVSFLPRPAP